MLNYNDLQQKLVEFLSTQTIVDKKKWLAFDAKRMRKQANINSKCQKKKQKNECGE